MIYKLTTKDWERMQDLIDRDQNGESVAKKIHSADKAVARFVAGVILENRRDDIISYGFHWSRFKAFGQVALDLGAKKEDIIETIVKTEIPADFKANHVTKKSYSGYLGSLERVLDKMQGELGFELKREYTDYKDWSYETRAQYNSNGRVWPLNYRFTAKLDGKEVTFTVIVVTNEGGGNYGYDFNRCRLPWGVVKERIESTLKSLVA